MQGSARHAVGGADPAAVAQGRALSLLLSCVCFSFLLLFLSQN